MNTETTAKTSDQVSLELVNGRRSGRFVIAGLTCSAGSVIDLCRDGMRIESRSKLSDCFTVEIVDRVTTVYVTAEVVWSRRVGLFRRIYGLRFLNPSRETVAQLASIAHARSKHVVV